MRMILQWLAAGFILSVFAFECRAGTVVVSPTSPNGWVLTTFDGTYTENGAAGTAAYVTGPATPPAGTGSVNLATNAGYGDGGAMVGTSAYSGTLLSSITSLIYSTYMTVNNGQQFPYLAISFSTDGSGDPGSIDNAIFEPPYQTPSSGNPSLPNQGDTALNTWQTWDALDGGWDLDGADGTNVVSWATVLSTYPNATIMDWPTPYQFFLGVQFQVGQGSSTDNFNGNIDNFTVGINGVNTTYDFEATGPNPVPEPITLASLAMMGLAVCGWGGLRRRKNRIVAL